MSPGRRRAALVLVAGGLPTGLLLTAVLVPAAEWARIPGRVADHWGVAGAPNGSGPKLVAFAVAVGLAVAGSGIVAYWGRVAWSATDAAAGDAVRTWRGSRLLAGGLVVAGIGALLSIDLTLVNLDAPRWQDARQPVPAFLVLFVGAAALGAAGTVSARRLGLGWAGGADRPAVARLGLGESERALWLGRADNGWALALGIVGVGAAVGAGVFSRWEVAAVVGAVSVAVASLSSATVSASAAGVVVRYGPLRWPRTRIPLRRIAGAEAVELAPRGWGYRGSLRLVGTAAVVVHRGAALSLDLVDGKSFLVTVDDASTAAALLNDELARASSGEVPDHFGSAARRRS